LPRVIVWDKGNTAVLRRNGYHSCYELIYYAFREGGGGRWFGPRDSEHADDIWRHRVEHGDERVHLTQKPVALPRRAIENTCPAGGIVFEPFGGSGSTLIAAEQAGRRCALMELDPLYCQTILDRWEAFTGLRAEALA
jgi:DNA modification methylase